MNTDIRNGLGVLCLAAVLGLLRLIWAPTDSDNAGVPLSTGALAFALIGLFLLMKGLFARD